MNSIQNIFKSKENNLLSIYFTCGFPELNDTAKVIDELGKSGVDFLEVGLPYSDPMADGPTIQYSSSVALKNGVNLDVIFEQLLAIKETNKVFRAVIRPYRVVFSKITAVWRGTGPVGVITQGQDLTTTFSGYIDFNDWSFKVELEVVGGPKVSLPAEVDKDDSMMYIEAKAMYFLIENPAEQEKPFTIQFLGAAECTRSHR